MESSLDERKAQEQLAEASEALAYVDWIESAPASLKEKARAYTGKLGKSTIIFTVPEIDWYTPNRLMGFGLSEPAEESMLDEALKIVKERHTSRFFVPLCPDTEPGNEELRRWLIKRGFYFHNSWVKLSLDTSENHPSPKIKCDFTIQEISRDSAQDFAATLLAGFGYPESFRPWLELLVGKIGWHHYLAFDGAKPVANGALFVRNRIGYLCLGSTIPSARRRGAQEALIERRIHDAASAGCDVLFTETEAETPAKPNPSFHNMLRSGFKLLYSRENYAFDLSKSQTS